MSQEELWYGFLEAGDRSTPVARDPKLTTGNPDTVYMYNLQRNEIIEYKRAICEPKLRELKPAEADSGMVLRLLNPTDAAREARLHVGLPLSSAVPVRLDETPCGDPLAIDGGAFTLAVPPHALRSLLLSCR